MQPSAYCLVSVAVLASIASCHAVAQEVEESPELRELSEGVSARGGPEVQPYYYHFATANSTAGDVGQSKAGARLLYAFSPDDRWFIELGGTGEYSSYSIPGLDDALSSTRGVTVSGFEKYSLEVNAAYRASDAFTYLFFGKLTSARESGTGFGDSVRSTVAAASRYAINSELGVLAGVAAFTRLERDGFISPLLGLDWRIHERWDLLVGLPDSQLVYKATDRVQLALTLGFEFDDYRLDQPGELDGGVMTSKLITLALSTRWRWSDYGTASLILGQSVFNELEFLDSSGRTDLEVVIDSQPFVGLELGFSL